MALRNVMAHRKFLKVAGILILGVVLYRVGPRSLWARMQHLGWGTAVLALGLSIPHLACKSERWRRMLAAASGVRMNAGYSFFAYLGGIAMGAFTPGRAGEFFRAWLPARSLGASLAAALASVVIDRLFDLAFLAMVSCAAGAFLLGFPWGGLLFLAPFLLYLFRLPLGRLLSFLTVRLPVPEDGRRQFFDACRRALSGWPSLSMWTIAGYSFMNLQVYVIARGLGASVGFGELFLLFGLANAIALLPVSVLGLGTREAALGALFLMTGHGEAHGVSIALSFFLLGSIPVVLAGAIWLIVHRSAAA